MNEKTSINSIYPNLWAPTARLLQGLTVMQQCVYQMKFRNVWKVKKRLVQSALVWSRTLSILLSINEESVSLPVFAYQNYLLIGFQVTVKNVGDVFLRHSVHSERQECTGSRRMPLRILRTIAASHG